MCHQLLHKPSWLPSAIQGSGYYLESHVWHGAWILRDCLSPSISDCFIPRSRADIYDLFDGSCLVLFLLSVRLFLPRLFLAVFMFSLVLYTAQSPLELDSQYISINNDNLSGASCV